MGKGRTLRDIWREQGFTPEQVEEKYQARIDLITAVKRRNHAARLEKDALTLGLGDAEHVPRDIEKSKKALTREFRLSPLKGVQHQSTVLKRQQARQRREERSHEAAYNPRVKGLAGVDGVTTDADGTVRLKALRKQRPDIFQMKPMPIEGKPNSGRMERINELRKAEGRKDKFYDNITK